MTTERLLRTITDSADEGIICIDDNFTIQLFNRRAKEITGILLDKTLSHPGGKIEPGDIVLIADNWLGGDDGDMTPEDLKFLNIKDKDILRGSALLAVGVYQNSEIVPLYKYYRQGAAVTEMKLSATYLGFLVSLEINESERYMDITVNHTSYRMKYLQAVGHIVIIDGKTGTVKFFQAKGYTIRKEALRSILHGYSFLPKGIDSTEINVVGANLLEFVEHSELTKKAKDILEGKEHTISNEFFTINKRLVLVSVYPVTSEGKMSGLVLKIMDLSEMDTLLRERNNLIAKVEETNLNIDNSISHIPSGAFSGFVGSSQPIRQVKYLAYRASQTRFNVILTGESGTGKSQLAREIHQLYKPGAPFVEVNCSSIPPNLFESELFGYVGGAFTGALSTGKQGYFEMANGGTIFLDELGEIPPDVQVKLLHVLQNKSFYRLGSAKSVNIDVRVISATNKNLAKEVQLGRFREDLYYRINVFPIEVPPLRERMSDIYLLINNIMGGVCAEYDLPLKQFSGEALEKLLQYTWPGNIRELENVLERAVTICESKVIYPEHINVGELAVENAHPVDSLYAGEGFSYGAATMKEILRETEKNVLRNSLAGCNGNKQQAMKKLGMKKSVFYDKLQKYGLE